MGVEMQIVPTQVDIETYFNSNPVALRDLHLLTLTRMYQELEAKLPVEAAAPDEVPSGE